MVSFVAYGIRSNGGDSFATAIAASEKSRDTGLFHVVFVDLLYLMASSYGKP